MNLEAIVGQIIGTGPVAALLFLAGFTFWRSLQAKESCKDPRALDPNSPPRENPPCLRCLACKDRQLADQGERIHDAIGRLETALADAGKNHVLAVKAQEEAHAAEVAQERSRNDALTTEIISIFRGEPEE